MMRLAWRYEANKRRERLMMSVVWRLPRWLLYWAVIRAACMSIDEYPGEVTARQMLDKIGAP